MFTGIIEKTTAVKAITPKGNASVLRIDLGELAAETKLGDSVAISGVCLTVTQLENNVADFDVSAETIKLSTLKDLRTGSRVNLERALRADGRLGGHFVQGHVDGVGVMRKLVKSGEAWDLEVEVDREMIGQMVPKGSIAIDGISLTITHITGLRFGVAVIPHTFENTTLRDKKTGAAVNVELDILGKYVRRYLGADEKITPEFLRKHGF